MKKAIIVSCLIGSALLILDRFDFFNSLLMFLLIGAVPGTKYSISPILMLVVLLGLLGAGLFQLAFTKFTARLR